MVNSFIHENIENMCKCTNINYNKLALFFIFRHNVNQSLGLGEV